jgi:hypothetical protein
MIRAKQGGRRPDGLDWLENRTGVRRSLAWVGRIQTEIGLMGAQTARLFGILNALGKKRLSCRYSLHRARTC